MPCSFNFSITLQTKNLSTVATDFLKQMIILKSFNSLLKVSLSTLRLCDSHSIVVVLTFQGKGEMKTYWLAGRDGEECTKTFVEEIRKERTTQMLQRRYV